MLAVVCKRMQQLSTMLGLAVHRGKDTTHKSLLTMRNERARSQQSWKSCANGSNIVALRFGDHAWGLRISSWYSAKVSFYLRNICHECVYHAYINIGNEYRWRGRKTENYRVKLL